MHEGIAQIFVIARMACMQKKQEHFSVIQLRNLGLTLGFRIQSSMQNVDLMIHSRWIIPVEADERVLEHHSLIVNGERLDAIIPTKQAKQNYLARTEKNLDTHVLFPGFVNSHTHTAMSLLRGMGDDLPLMDWLQNHIWPAESRWVSPEFVEDGTQLAAAEMLLSGTTCVNDMYFFPDVAAQIFTRIGMRANIGLIIIDFPTNWANSADEYFSKGLEIADTFKSHPLINCSFAPHSPYTVSNKNLERVAMLNEELELGIHIHLHETEEEIYNSVKLHNLRPIERLNNIGILGPGTQAVHLTQINSQDLDILTNQRVHAIHCPQSNLKLASGFSPVHKIKQAGINVALGTDSAASNNSLDMLAEMKTAALLAKAVAKDATVLSAHKALEMATLSGAKALGRAHEIGSLSVGKKADVVALDLKHCATYPIDNPLTHLVYSAQSHQITDVWVGGRQLVNNRQLVSINAEETMTKANQWRQKIQQEG